MDHQKIRQVGATGEQCGTGVCDWSGNMLFKNTTFTLLTYPSLFFESTITFKIQDFYRFSPPYFFITTPSFLPFVFKIFF